MKFLYKQIGKNLGFSNILESILKNRGITSPKEFLNLGEHNIEDFSLYDNMNEAVVCFDKHIKNNSKIAVVVDYDTDGYTSSTELYSYTKEICEHLSIEFKMDYIIHSKKEHGLTNDIMLKIEEGKYNLIIVPDAGSNDYKAHETLHKNNIEVIVLDHHQAEKYSEYAIVVNNQLSNKITNKAMTGVGVVYKFCKALDSYYGVNYADNYLDLVSVGMIADSCDLTNLESRYLVSKGLELIQNNTNKNKFITKIFKEKSYSMKSKVTISNVAFYMSPFINCIIRGGDYDTKVLLFKAFIGTDELFKDKIRGKGEVELSIEDYMVRIYTKLKKIQDVETEKGLNILSEQVETYELNKHEIIVVNSEGLTNTNYNRVIANKLSNKYNKHCILLKKYKDSLRGSASGCKNKEIIDLRQWCLDSNLFKMAEGHPMAFGCEVPFQNINSLYETISKLESSDILTYYVDAIFNENTLNKSIIEIISKYNDIWGNGLAEPLFAIENLIIESDKIELIGKNKNTIKFTHKNIDFLKFNENEDTYNKIKEHNQIKLTIIGKFSINNYNNVISPQVIIEDFNFEKSEIVKKFVF